MPDLLWFEVDGLRIGGQSSDLIVTDLDWGPVDRATNDVTIFGSDGVMVGRDTLGKQVVSLSLSTDYEPSDEALQQALALQERLFGIWWDRSKRAPGAVTELVYQVEGRERRVYGRPRQISGFTVEVVARQGAGRIEAQFEVTKPGTFGVAQQVRIDAVPESSGGLIAPLVAPLVTTMTGGTRQGLVDVTGGAEAYPAVTFHGPSTDPFIRSDDGRWEIGLVGSLAYDQTATIDLMTNTISLPGNVSFNYATDLTAATLVPGSNSITYSAVDATGTSYVLVDWRHAYNSF